MLGSYGSVMMRSPEEEVIRKQECPSQSIRILSDLLFYFLNILADKEEKGKSRRAYKKRAFGFTYAI
jgi:hypothetical protein